MIGALLLSVDGNQESLREEVANVRDRVGPIHVVRSLLCHEERPISARDRWADGKRFPFVFALAISPRTTTGRL